MRTPVDLHGQGRETEGIGPVGALGRFRRDSATRSALVVTLAALGHPLGPQTPPLTSPAANFDQVINSCLTMSASDSLFNIPNFGGKFVRCDCEAEWILCSSG